METFAGLWGFAKGKMDHLLPAHLKEEKKNVLKAVAIVETTNTNAMMVPTVKITEDPAQILSDYTIDGDEVVELGLTFSRSNTASTRSSSSGAYNDSFNSSGNSSMTSLVSSGSEATIGGDGKAVHHGNHLDDNNIDYSIESTSNKTSARKPFDTANVNIYQTADAKICKSTNDLIKTQSTSMEFPAAGSIQLICGKLYVPSKSCSSADVTAEASPESRATDRKPSLVDILNQIADVSSETDAVYYKKTATAILNRNVDVSPVSFNARSFSAADTIADKPIHAASKDIALDHSNSRILGAIINKIDELSANCGTSCNKRIPKAADLELHQSVGATIRKVDLDYAAASDDLLVFDNVSDKIYVNRESFAGASHFEINADGELKPAYAKVSITAPYTPLDLLPRLDYPPCASTPLEVDRQCFTNPSCPVIFIQDFSTEKLAYDPHLGGVDLAYTAMKNREKFGVPHLWIGWKPKGGKGYEREKGDEADAGAFRGLKVWCDKDVEHDEEREDDEEDDEDADSDEENDDDQSESSDEDESGCDSDDDSSEEESDDEDDLDGDDGGVDVVFG